MQYQPMPVTPPNSTANRIQPKPPMTRPPTALPPGISPGVAALMQRAQATQGGQVPVPLSTLHAQGGVPPQMGMAPPMGEQPNMQPATMPPAPSMRPMVPGAMPVKPGQYAQKPMEMPPQRPPQLPPSIMQRLRVFR